VEKRQIIVPRGIRYLSDWKDYSLSKYDFPHILNKLLTGCGFTEYCLTNEQDLILCSPRRILLENKEDQHPGEVFYVRNEYEKIANFEKDLERKKDIPSTKGPDESWDEYYERLETERLNGLKTRVISLKNEVVDYYKKCKRIGRPVKFLVTYDSFRHVKEALNKLGVLPNFQVVIDEFQSIFVDARFKADTELEFVEQVQDLQKVCFVSATPMIESYLDQMDEFKDLPYIELDWIKEDPNRVTKPNLEITWCGPNEFPKKTLAGELKKIVRRYRANRGDMFSQKADNGEVITIQSTEAVLYLNSVKDICNAIKSNHLTLDECNVLCARTKENEIKLRKAFRITDNKVQVIGKVPKKDETRKMFTFCTRTVYLGADFYSPCARTFIFSDANIDSLSVDITLDLPQIMGRQRLEINPWKDRAEMFIVTNCKKEITKEQFDDIVKNKKRITEKLLRTYNNEDDIEGKRALLLKYSHDIDYSSYSEDYIGISRHSGSQPAPVLNNLVLIAEQRAFDIQQLDYKDRFTVFNRFESMGLNYANQEVSKMVDKYAEDLKSLKSLEDKLKLFYDTVIDINDPRILDNILQVSSTEFVGFYNVLGLERIKALGYRRERLRDELQVLIGSQGGKLRDSIMKRFVIGEKYTKADIKAKIQAAYNENNISKKAKASEIENWFEVKYCLISNPKTNKRDPGFEILQVK